MLGQFIDGRDFLAQSSLYLREIVIFAQFIDLDAGYESSFSAP